MKKGKKSKKCGMGKLPDGKGGCRKMTSSEKEFLKSKTVQGAIAPSMTTIYKAGPKAAAVAGAIGAYRAGKKAKKRMSNFYKKKR